MNIPAIQTFLAVVRTGNLNRAADEVNITQSAVTARLDALESALKSKLLVRSRKGATLTKAGFAFFDQAQIIAQTWENARNRLSLPTGITRMFSLVCDPNLWTGCGDNWVAALSPETAAEIWTAGPKDAHTWLQSGMSDAAILAEPLIGDGLTSKVLLTEGLIQVSSSPRDVMTWDPAYIYVDYGPSYRAQHTAAWPTAETAFLGFNNPDWAIAHLLKNGGSAYLPQRLVGPFLQSGQLHPVKGSTMFEQTIYLSWRTESQTQFPWLGG